MNIPVDIVVINGRVITMDCGSPLAEAVAISGGRILAVGANDEVMALRGASTRVIDAQWKTVMPGINESHIHIFGASVELDQLSLSNVSGLETMKSAILAYAANKPADPLLIANGADYTILGDGRSLDRHILDSVVQDRPLAVMSPDHHTVWANTIALEKAGILHGRDLPSGNEIVMGGDGLATGELREHYAFDDVIALSATGGRDRLGLSAGDEPNPPPTAAERSFDLAVLRRGLKHLAQHGITSFQNMDGNRYQLELLSELYENGELLCRGRIPLHYVKGNIEQQMDKGAAMAAEYNTEWLRSGTVKVFMDGVLDSHTALMYDDYEDKPGWRGEARFDENTFEEICVQADRRGLQVAVHSIGDGAVSRVIDGYAAARYANGDRDSRHRIEHIEVVRDVDIGRMRDMAIIASMQPPHPPGQMGLPLEPTISRIGKKNWPRAYAWRAIREAGIKMILSSDWPISPVSPMRSIHSAMTRKPWAEGLPDNRQTLMEALESYTTNAAYAEFAEDWKGKLKKGFAGDLVIFDTDLQAVDPEQIETVRPVITICGGMVTFEA